MASNEIKNIVEALIFASEEEITTRQIKEIADSSGIRISANDIEASINSLNDDYKAFNKSFEIIKIAGGYSFSTKKEYGRFVGKLFEEKQKKKLSQSSLETLSIIAYKQPITRNEIEFVRGVNVDYIVNSLLERDLIKIHGRADSPGRPILYATTNTFLKVLGLNSIDDLPKLKEINEILKNQEIEGITEADIELFNSVNDTVAYESKESGQLELITNEIPENENNEVNDNSGTDTNTDRDSQSENTDSAESAFDIIEEIDSDDAEGQTESSDLNNNVNDNSNDDDDSNDDDYSNDDEIDEEDLNEERGFETAPGEFKKELSSGENDIKNFNENSDLSKDENENENVNLNEIKKENENENDYLTKEGEEDSE